ncbi:MAG: FUSC family protein [Bacteroidales bacterium]
MNLKAHLLRVIQRIKLGFITAKTIAVFISFIAGGALSVYFHNSSSYLGAMLAAISAIVVLQTENLSKSINQGWLRVLGSFIGALIAYIYLLFFPFSLPGMCISIFFLGIICMLLSVPDNGKMATVVLIWVFIRSMDSTQSPLLNGFLRFTESTIGVTIGLITAYFLEKLNILFHNDIKDNDSKK